MRFPYQPRYHKSTAIAGAPALEVVDLAAGYPGVAALAGINLTVTVGSRVALVGPNGAGKSTLLMVVGGLLPPRTGRVNIYGQPVAAGRQQVAYLPQRSQIDWRFPISLRQLVMTGRYIHLGWLARPGREEWAIVDEKIGQLGLTELAGRQISQLSGGQQQRTLLARALAQEASLLLLDEPLNAIDNETRAIVSHVLAGLKGQGKTAMVATHDLGRLDTDFDQAIYLCEGRQVPPPPGGYHHCTGVALQTMQRPS